MQHEKAIKRSGRWTRRAIAFFLFLPAFACRDAEPPGLSPQSATFVLLPGDRFVYDIWATTAWGTALDTSLTLTEWLVLTSDPGGSGLVTIERTRTPIPPRPSTRDTFALRSTPDGRIQRQGFLSELIAKRERRAIPVRWDTLAELQGSAWQVGSLDSTGEQRMVGNYASRSSYVTVTIDGNSIIIPARHIELSAQSLDYDLWLSSSPPCLPLWEEHADSYLGITRGSRAILREAYLTPGPRN